MAKKDVQTSPQEAIRAVCHEETPLIFITSLLSLIHFRLFFTKIQATTGQLRWGGE
jgi:hypothetical protein